MRTRTHKSGLLALALALLAPACSEGSFGGGGGGIAGGGKKESKKEAAADEDDEQQPELPAGGESLGNSALGEDPEDDKADQPAMVAGAFLTCAEDPSVAQADATKTGVGCAVMVGKTKMNMDEYTRHWTLMNAFNTEVPAEFVAAPGTPWHVMTAVPKTALQTYKVKLQAQKGDKVAAMYGAIVPKSAPPQQPPAGPSQPTAAQPQQQTLGETSDFQLGDDNFSKQLNQGCIERLQAVALSGHGMRVPFTVKDKAAQVAISLLDMCGVTRSDNVVRVVAAGVMGAEKFEEKVVAKSMQFEVPGMTLDPGDYVLEILSPYSSYSKDRDDFIVGRIQFTSSGAVTVGTPAAFTDY